MSGFTIKDLINKGVMLDLNIDNNVSEEEENGEEERCKEALLDHLNMSCLGEIEHEDTYVEGDPFTNIASKMEDVHEGGKLKKRVLRKGSQKKPQSKDIVRVHYNSYVEFEAQPFDSTYVRKRPHQFCLDNSEVLPGLDLAVQSMHLNEKSQFLIHPDLAYGKMGCLRRIPPNATVLFEIELVTIVDAASAHTYSHLPEEKQKDFTEIYKYCMSLCAKGKDLFTKNFRGAIKEYNTAVHKLENAQLRDYADQEQQEELLMKLYTNLLVCYTKAEEPKKGCINANRIFHLTKNTRIKIPVKVFFNHAKCLRMLGEYSRAKHMLREAHNLEPTDPLIAREFELLESEIQKQQKTEVALAKAMIPGAK